MGNFYAFEVLFFISFFSLNGLIQQQQQHDNEDDDKGVKQLDGMLNCASTLADIDFTDGLFSLPMHI